MELKNEDGDFMILSPEQAARLAENGEGIVGIRFGTKGEGLVISAVLPDGPAGKADIKPGDRILAIDGRPARGLSVESAHKNIRGKIGTRVVLKIQRDSQVLKIPLLRERRSSIDPAAKRPRRKLDIRELPQGSFKDKRCPVRYDGCNWLHLLEDKCVYTCPK